MEEVKVSALSEQISLYRSELDALFSKTLSERELRDNRIRWLGNSGIVKTLFRRIREVSAEERPKVAAGLNSLRDHAESLFGETEALLDKAKLEKELSNQFFDLTLPSKSMGIGAIHPIAKVERTIVRILRECGFAIVEGPEIETDYFCFDALNIPPHHPARDLQDTFYTETGHVLRTHTTSVQARVLKQGGLPVKVASFGKAYRNESEDATHQAMFHQFELMWVEKGLVLSHLVGLIEHLMRELYGPKRKIKFVPKFYPYTEPSIGVLLSNSKALRKRLDDSQESDIGDDEWATVAGAGMIHENVLREFGYDPSQVSGLAFGLGTSRLAAQLYGFSDLRSLYENDLRLLTAIQG
jgi:phenylalanyl-tRNA synthetase alpha chain